MRCDSAHVLITKRYHEPLTSGEAKALGRHLERCPACRAEQAGDHRFEEYLRHETEPARSAAGRRPRVDPVAVREHVRSARSRTRPRYWGQPQVAAVAALALVLILGLAFWPTGRSQTAAGRSDAGPPHSVQPVPPGDTDPTPWRGAPTVRGTAHGALTDTRAPAVHAWNAGPKIARRRDGSPATADRGSTRQPLPDEQYLDGRDPQLAAWWTAAGNPDERRGRAATARLPEVRDDFVRIALPRLAGAAPKSPAIAEAARRYEKEAAVVDARLFQKVTLQVKGMALDEFCAAFSKKTGVRLQASRGVQDEKVTVFVKDRPVRDVMRSVARLFGYLWSRSGEENAYRYELMQDLRSQLAEQEMRNQDSRSALVGLDNAMRVYREETETSVDRLKARLESSKGADRERLSVLVQQGGWGAARLYQRLSPAELETLRSGQQLHYGLRAGNRNRLPEEWRRPLLEANDLHIEQSKQSGQPGFGSSGTPVADYPGATPTVTLWLDRSELGHVTLKAAVGVSLSETDLDPGARFVTLATGRSASAARPENARINQSLRSQAPFDREVRLRPTPSCPRCAPGAAPDETESYGLPDPVTSEPHVTTADVWEELHRVTGLPIVADYYTRLHSLRAVTVEKAKLFDALCHVADVTGVRWRKDGEFILGRSTSFFWDKLKEVPNATLARWQTARRAGGGLPLEQMLEVAQLSDQQLESEIVGKGVEHCWGISEWSMFGRGIGREGAWQDERRRCARVLSMLTPAQLQRVFAPQGLSGAGLTPAQQREFVLLTPALLGTTPTIHAAYVPAGWHLWQPIGPPGRTLPGPFISGQTPKDALTAARRLDPGARLDDIRRSRGMLVTWFVAPDGRLIFEAGGDEPEPGRLIDGG